MRADVKLNGKIVVVTGAANGIGRALKLELERRGARVAGVDLKETDFTVNVTDRAAVDALPAQVIERFGAVDGLINCAGVIQPFVPLHALDYAAIDRVFDVNFRGTLHMTKAFLPVLMQRPEAHVCNISSMGGFMPIPGQAIYGASKAAVKLMTEGLHAEMRDTRVRVTVVFPGGIDTNIAGNSGVEMKVAGEEKMRKLLTSPERAARQILDGIERDRFRVLVGADARLLDFLYRLNPARATGFIARQLKGLMQ